MTPWGLVSVIHGWTQELSQHLHLLSLWFRLLAEQLLPSSSSWCSWRTTSKERLVMSWRNSSKSSDSSSISVSLIIFTACKQIISRVHLQLLQEILPLNDLLPVPKISWEFTLIPMRFPWLKPICGLERITVHCLYFISQHLAIAPYFSFGLQPIPHFTLSLTKLLHLAGQSENSLPRAISDSVKQGLYRQLEPRKGEHQNLWGSKVLANQKWTLELGWAWLNQSIQKII